MLLCQGMHTLEDGLDQQRLGACRQQLRQLAEAVALAATETERQCSTPVGLSLKVRQTLRSWATVSRARSVVTQSASPNWMSALPGAKASTAAFSAGMPAVLLTWLQIDRYQRL